MIKRILGAPLLFRVGIIIATILVCILVTEYRGAPDTDLSIRSLELELKEAHKINDRYSGLIGKEKKELIDTLRACEGKKTEFLGALVECSEVVKTNRGRALQCSQVLDMCNSELEMCIITYER